jgi:hypothetical protein
VVNQPSEPGSERNRTVIAMSRVHESQNGVLHDIFCLARIPEQAVGLAKAPVDVLGEQRIEFADIPVLDVTQEALIRIIPILAWVAHRQEG